jgi:DNA-binding LacI/PurR family transcriptional regulator
VPKVTLKALAAEVGVSYALVSRVLRGDPSGRISDAKRKQVLDLARERGYRANHAARSLRIQRTGVLAMVVPDITNPFFAALFRAVETAALAHGHCVILCNADEDGPQVERLLEVLGGGLVDGWILALARESWLTRLTAIDLPHVLLNRRNETGDRPWVGPADYQTGWLSGAHFAGLGHRRLAYLTADLRIGTMADRLAGFRAGIAESGAALDVVSCEMKAATIRPLVEALLSRPAPLRPTGLFVSNRLFLDGTLAAVRSLGLRIPQEVSVMGYNPFDDTLCTGIVVPVAEMGRIGTEWLVHKLQGGDPGHLSVALPVRLADHGTTAPPGP